MRIQFLGTGADDWLMYEGEKNDEYRRFSSVLIDEVLLIDPGPSVLEAAETFQCDLTKVKYVITTHMHRDHFNQETLDALVKMGAEFIPFTDGDVKEVGAYQIEALRSNHSTEANSVHFLIDDGTKRIFYGLDGAWLLETEVKAIKSKYVDLAVFDGTIGDCPGDYRIFVHNNLSMVEEMKKSLEKHINRFIITHMAYTLHTDHNTLVARMQESGIEVAFDGLILEL